MGLATEGTEDTETEAKERNEEMKIETMKVLQVARDEMRQVMEAPDHERKEKARLVERADVVLCEGFVVKNATGPTAKAHLQWMHNPDECTTKYGTFRLEQMLFRVTYAGEDSGWKAKDGWAHLETAIVMAYDVERAVAKLRAVRDVRLVVGVTPLDQSAQIIV